MMVLMQCLNTFWFFKILLGVHRVLTKGKSEMKSGSRDAEQTQLQDYKNLDNNDNDK